MLRGRYPGFFKRQIIRIFKKRGRNFYEKERVKKFKRSILDSYSNKPDMKKHKSTEFGTCWYLMMLGDTN